MNKINIKDSMLAFVFGFALCQVMVFIATLIIGVVFSFFNNNLDILTNFLNHNCWGYLICSIFLNLGLFIIFWIFKRKKEDKIISSKLSTKKVLLYIGFAIFVFLLLYPITEKINTFLPTKKPPYNMQNTQNYLVSILSLALLPAIFEELLFRGVIFTGLKRFGKTTSIVLTAVMFSVFHMSLSQTIYPLLMGLFLSVIMYKENNILYTIITHFVSNFIVITLMYFNVNLMFNHWSYWILAIVLACLFLTFIVYCVIKMKPTQSIKITSEEKFYFYLCSSIMLVLWIILAIVSVL